LNHETIVTKPTKYQFLIDHALDALLVFIPVAAVLHYLHAPEIWTFVASGLAIIPLAGWMGKATESLSEKLGAGIGGLLNATFGNAAEMIIAVQGLRAGLTEVVKASLTGSILGNILLVLGASIVAGGFKYRSQKINRTAALGYSRNRGERGKEHQSRNLDRPVCDLHSKFGLRAAHSSRPVSGQSRGTRGRFVDETKDRGRCATRLDRVDCVDE
jgi:hypothetical protein